MIGSNKQKTENENSLQDKGLFAMIRRSDTLLFEKNHLCYSTVNLCTMFLKTTDPIAL